ncbi:unnamed protein product [Paramecium pentaurelia]|uniref:Uncharacterized protein n=1 Tax=Paramecium pentaurelia TaxID=43138 RepID=A0A8S1VTB3_9CILI|nr:unnamed protein product [Paramecium pentaurelia]
MGCNVQKSKSQSNKLCQAPQEILESARIANEQDGLTHGQKSDIKESENLVSQQQQVQIGRRLKHMASSDELNKFINKKHSNPQSHFGYIKNSPEQRRKQSLMNSPKL